MKTVKINCSGTTHRIGFEDNNTIVFFDHDVEAELIAVELGAPLPRCITIAGDNKKLLAWGAEHGALAAVEFAIKSCFPMYIEVEKENALIVAVRENHPEVVRFLLDNGVNVHTGYEKPLCDAAFDGRYDMVKLLLEYGAYPGGVGYPIGIAIRQGHTEISKLLLDHLPDPTLGFSVGAADEAILVGNLAILKYIFGRIVEIYPHQLDWMARIAKEGGHQEIVDFLERWRDRHPDAIIQSTGGCKEELDTEWTRVDKIWGKII